MRHNPGLPRLLLTRPRPAAELLARHFSPVADVLISPLLAIVPNGQKPVLRPDDRLVVTSQNTLSFLGDLPTGRASAVGPETARALTALGWEVAAFATADDLVAALITEKPRARVVHLRGEHGRGNITERLKLAGIETELQILYHQQACDLTTAARDWLGGERPVVLPLFSSRTARQFCQQGPFAAPLFPVAISQAVAADIASGLGLGCAVATTPDGEAMKEAIQRQIDAVTLLESDGATE